MVICFHRFLSESEPSAVMSIMGKTDPWCDKWGLSGKTNPKLNTAVEVLTRGTNVGTITDSGNITWT